MELTEQFFKDNFFDIRKHRPKKGQVLAQYRACAHFVDDWVKRNIITMLQANKAGAESAVKVMRNLCGASEIDSIRVPLAMAQDLTNGMTVDEVAAKEYPMIVEYNFWTMKENVPDNPHWSTITLLNSIESNFKTTYSGPGLESEPEVARAEKSVEVAQTDV